MKTIWKVIPIHPMYEASSVGLIRNKKTKRIIKPTIKNGYLKYRLKDSTNTLKGGLGHRIVYRTFNGPIPEGHHIDHINRIRSDNSIKNLRSVSPEENWGKRFYSRIDKSLSISVIQTIIEQYKQGKTAEQISIR